MSPRPTKIFEITSDTSAEPYPFALKIQPVDENENPVGDPELIEFEADGNAGVRGDLAIASMIRFTQDNVRHVDPNAMMMFFQAVLVPGDFARLYDTVNRRDIHVELTDIATIFTWLVEELTGRPTRVSAGSVASPSPNGGTSTAKRRARAGT